jgi:hypothetical protein
LSNKHCKSAKKWEKLRNYTVVNFCGHWS